MQIANKYLPFGGVGGSGYGRMHGVYGFKAFSNPKSVALLSSLDTYPSNKRYMPWTDDKKNLMRKVLKVAFYTPGQIGKVLGLIILVIVGAILCGVLIPRQ
jgi:aldehyde dehydrogenase (NAD+)